LYAGVKDVFIVTEVVCSYGVEVVLQL